MVFGFFEGPKVITKLSKGLLSKYGNENGEINVLYDAIKHKFIVVPKDQTHDEYMSELLSSDREDFHLSENAKKTIPLTMEFDEHDKITRLITGYSHGLEQLKTELVFEADDIKLAHAKMLKMIYDEQLNSPNIREKMFI